MIYILCIMAHVCIYIAKVFKNVCAGTLPVCIICSTCLQYQQTAEEGISSPETEVICGC